MVFSKKEKKQLDESAPTLIGASCSLEGNIKAGESVCVEGKIVGHIDSEQNVYINKDAVVEGDIIAQNVVIHGKIIGNVTAKEAIVIGSTGKVIGDVNTKLFSVETGGVLHGRCFMETQINNPEEHSKMKSLFEKFSNITNKKAKPIANDITTVGHSLSENLITSEEEDDIVEVTKSADDS